MTYSPAALCTDAHATGTFTVTNNGNGYSIACTGCGAQFNAYGICALTSCTSGTDFDYTIKLDIITNALGGALTNVNYSTTSVANGDTIDSSCTTVSAVSPTSQSWIVNDTTFPCSYDCANDSSVTITYQ